MKKIFLLIIIGYAFTLEAQNNYSFNRSVGTYTKLTGTTSFINGTWDYFEKGIKLPFPFKLYKTQFTDSLYIDYTGSINVDNTFAGDIVFIEEDLRSRGNNQSEVSYKVDGVTPARIFKLQFNNAGFFEDLSNKDSVNIQVWLYETSNVIEYRYGPGSVKAGTWTDLGPVTLLFNPADTTFISIEGNPSNPVVHTSNLSNIQSLTGWPSSGTIYRFTPAQFPAGITNASVRIDLINNKISIPASMEIKSVKVYDTNGRLVQSGLKADEIDLSYLAPGLYLVAVETKDGVLCGKLIL